MYQEKFKEGDKEKHRIFDSFNTESYIKEHYGYNVKAPLHRRTMSIKNYCKNHSVQGFVKYLLGRLYWIFKRSNVESYKFAIDTWWGDLQWIKNEYPEAVIPFDSLEAVKIAYSKKKKKEEIIL